MNYSREKARPWIGTDTLGSAAITGDEAAVLFDVKKTTVLRYLADAEKELTGVDNPVKPLCDDEGRLIKRETSGSRLLYLYDRAEVSRLFELVKKSTEGPDTNLYADRDSACALLNLSPAIFNRISANDPKLRDPTFPQTFYSYDNKRRNSKGKGWLSKYAYWLKSDLVDWMQTENYKKLKKAKPQPTA